MAHATNNGTISGTFAATSGVKQGSALAPTLFSLISPAMLMNAYRDEHLAVSIGYGTDGLLLNAQRMQTLMQALITIANCLLLADCRKLGATRESPMQRDVDPIDSGCASFGLTINTDKTVLTHQSAPEEEKVHRLPKASQALGRLQACGWSR
ncbi:DNA topoisomerase 2-beta [Sparganum proliferum]